MRLNECKNSASLSVYASTKFPNNIQRTYSYIVFSLNERRSASPPHPIQVPNLLTPSSVVKIRYSKLSTTSSGRYWIFFKVLMTYSTADSSTKDLCSPDYLLFPRGYETRDLRDSRFARSRRTTSVVHSAATTTIRHCSNVILLIIPRLYAIQS